MGAGELYPDILLIVGSSLYDFIFIIHRIPAIIYHNGQFIAFCEGRKDTVQDIGRIDIIFRRGVVEERRVHWGDVQVMASLFDYRSEVGYLLAHISTEMFLFKVYSIPQHLRSL